MADLKKLKSRRAGFKGVITKFKSDIQIVASSGDVALIKSRRESILGTLNKVDEINDQIYDLIDDEKSLEKEMIESADYNERIRIEIQILKDPLVTGLNPLRPTTANIKLPKVQLPTFSGEPTTWINFWDLFVPAIHSRGDLDNIQKLTYLKGQLMGEAKKLIDGYKIEASNYTVITKLLKDTYGQPDKIKLAHVQALLELPVISGDFQELLNFRAEFTSHIQSLDQLAITLKEFETILLFYKLPLKMREIMKRDLKENWIDFDAFSNKISEEIENARLSQTGISDTSDIGFVSPGTVTSFNVQNVDKTNLCCLCKVKGHSWFKCTQYQTPIARKGRAKLLGLCFLCLSRDHSATVCTFDKYMCRNCVDKHNFGLCVGNRKKQKSVKTAAVQKPTNTNKVSRDNDVQVKILATNTKGDNEVTILPTISLKLLNKSNQIIYSRALLDGCSERTFVLRRTIPNLKYRSRGTERMNLNGFVSKKEESDYELVTLFIPYRGKTISLNAVVVDELPDYTKQFALRKALDTFKLEGIKLADSQFSLPKERKAAIELLIGVDNYYNIVHPGYERRGDLILLPTIAGYVLTGKYHGKGNRDKSQNVSVLKVATSSIDHYLDKDEVNLSHKDDLERLWDLDHIGIMPGELDMESKSVLETFENSIEYSEPDKQYIVSLPWKPNHPTLPSNIGLARGRLKSLQCKFNTDHIFCEHYTAVVLDQERRGFIERVHEPEIHDKCHYLAHHGVKKDSRTTPVRIVFDCSAKGGRNMPSLNDCLYTGPSLISELSQNLMRFRLDKFATTSDIEKAFLMLQLKADDRDYTRFLWYESPLDPNSKIITYRFKVVLFGATCSQYLLNATILKHLSTVGEETRVLRRGLYIDNLQLTHSNESALIDLFHYAQNVFSSAHLHLREWVTNSNELHQVLQAQNLACAEQSTCKILGIHWQTEEDHLSLARRVPKEGEFTKRVVLSSTARIFDPLGFVLPVTIRARRFIQELWRRKLGWETTLPDDLKSEWEELSTELFNTSGVIVPRRINVGRQNIQLHAFCDASNSAYGAVVYFVFDNISTFIMAKAKVTPTRPMTIPKLELTALLIAARLVVYLQDSFKNEISFCSVNVWSDSQIVLSWLRPNKTLHLYVKNRVDEINTLLPTATFRYVPTKDNPSDLVTRGVSLKFLKSSSLWWNGPTWLPHKDLWPDELVTYTGADIDYTDQGLDNKPMEIVTCKTSTSLPVEAALSLNWNRFSSYAKYVHVCAWILRFVFNTRTEARNFSKTISVDEYKRAEIVLIRNLQILTFPSEYEQLLSKQGKKTGLVSQLNLELDEQGIIRCRGRMEFSDLPYDARNPILLPKKHPLTCLIVREAHRSIAHYGLNSTVSCIRQRWWIPQIRQCVKSILRGCIICRKLQGKPFKTATAPLPEFRTKLLSPFQITGVDYSGALQVKSEGKIVKAYIVLFTCPVTRAIHLEMVTNLSCESFLNAFRRFCGRRSFPQVMLSDNATTFVAASSSLKEIAEHQIIQNHLKTIKCEWRFIPVKAPWFGAIWERLIGVVKSGLRKVIGRSLVSLEELSSILVELEAIVNDRPLT